MRAFLGTCSFCSLLLLSSDACVAYLPAGLEGTGHHAWRSIFLKCPSDANYPASKGQLPASATTPFNCIFADDITEILYRGFDGTGGLFNPGSAKQLLDKKNELRTAFEEMQRKYEGAPEGTVVLLNLHETSKGSGFMSYPNYRGVDKPIHHPHLQLLALVAEEARVDLRVLVLQRDARAIYRSNTVNRHFGDAPVHEGLILAANAMSLHGQLELIDGAFFSCSHSLEPMSTEVFGDIANFLVPGFPAATKVAVVPTAMAMYGQLRPPSKRRGRKKDDGLDTPENAAVVDWLASTVGLIDASCGLGNEPRGPKGAL